MTFDEYWTALEEKNEAFKGADEDVIKLRLRGIKAMVKQAWERGADDAWEQAGKVSKLNDNTNNKYSSTSMPDFMQRFFGNKYK